VSEITKSRVRLFIGLETLIFNRLSSGDVVGLTKLCVKHDKLVSIFLKLFCFNLFSLGELNTRVIGRD